MGWKSKEAKSEYDRKRYEQRKSLKPKPEKQIPILLNSFDEIPKPEVFEVKGKGFTPRFNKRTEYILNRKYPEMVEMNRLKTELLDLEDKTEKIDCVPTKSIKRPLTFKL